MIKIKLEDDKYDSNTELPIIIIKCVGVIALAYAISFSEWPFVVVSVVFSHTYRMFKALYYFQTFIAICIFRYFFWIITCVWQNNRCKQNDILGFNFLRSN